MPQAHCKMMMVIHFHHLWVLAAQQSLYSLVSTRISQVRYHVRIAHSDIMAMKDQDYPSGREFYMQFI
jgi:hypothetical protein